MKLYSRDRARRSLVDTVGFRALSQVGTVLSYAVLVRSMSEQAFGVLNLLYAVIPIINTMGSLGLDHALRRFQPEYLRGGQFAAASWLLSVVRRLRFASNVVLIALILLIWNWVAPMFELGPYRSDFAIFSVLVLIHFQVTMLQYAMASQMLHRYSVGSAAVLSAVKLVVYLGLVSFGELTLRHAILADLAAYVLAFAFLSRAQRRLHAAEPVSLVARPDEDQRRRLKRYAIYSHWNDAASILQYNDTDRWFVAALMNSIVVGAYAFYTRFTDMLGSLVPLRLFDNVVQPLFFSVPKHEAQEKLPRYFTFLINLSLIFQLPLIAFTVVYHRDIVQFAFAGKFIEYSPLLPIMVISTMTDNVFSTPIHLIAQYDEKAPVILKSQITGFYQVAAMLSLVPLFGLYGAAFATGTFHIMRNVFVWWHVRKEAVWLNFRSVLLASLLVWGATIGICLWIRHATSWPPLAEMICGMFVCGLACLTYLRSPAISASDRSILGNVLHGREAKALQWIGLMPKRGQV